MFYIQRRILRAQNPVISPIGSQQKGDLFTQRSTWQNARGAIQGNARNYYLQHHPNPTCAICGYSLHVDIAHRKSVSQFPKETTIAEINHISNLVALCPNHHWEYDHGHLVLPV
jgi:hypothetical protein